MTKFDEKSLIPFGQCYTIDQLVDISLEKRGKDAWCLCSGRECLTKEGKWEFESLSSNRTEEFIEQTRFSSIKEAVTFYLEWRSKYYFFAAKGVYDNRWIYLASENVKKCEEYWKTVLGERSIFGRFLIIAPDRKIIRDEKAESGQDIKFLEFPSGELR